MQLQFIQAYFLTILLETVLLFLLLRNRYPAKAILFNSLIVNTLTLPAVWFLFPLLGLSYAFYLFVAEGFAFSAEAVLYALLFEKIDWRVAVFCSFTCNLLSFAVGALLTF
ncbi:MAG: hypothetical protein V1492_01425 [Candidatus Micrarchaeota archaeon]